MDSSQHASNRTSDTDLYLFRNDTNNITALQNARLMKKRMEEAARLHQERLDEAAKNLQGHIEDRAKVEQERDDLQNNQKIIQQERDELQRNQKIMQQELDDLRREKADLNQNISLKNGALETSMNELFELRGAKQEAENRLETLKATQAADRVVWETDMRRLNDQISSISSNLTARQADIQSLQQMVDRHTKQVLGSSQENSLPLQYHNATVVILNIRSLMALDVGKDNSTKAYGFEYGWENPWQIFKIFRANSNFGANDPWVITRKETGKRLYYPNGQTDLDVHVADSAPGKQDYWFIGRGSSDRVGSWVIKNAEWGTYIELSNSTRENGVRVKSYGASDSWDKHWVIVPLSFEA